MKRIFFVILLLLTACTSTATPTPPTLVPTIPTQHIQSDVSIENWREDLDFLTNSMETIHPNLFFHISEETFNEEIQRLNRNIPNLTNQQIMIEIMKLIALVKDGHTLLPPFQDETGFRMYPLQLYLFSDGLFVIDAYEPYQHAIGTKIVQISNMDVNTAYDLLSMYISHDNNSTVRSIMPVRFLIPEMLEAVGIIEHPEQPEFVLEKENGERITLNPKPIEFDEYKEWVFPENPRWPSFINYEELTFLTDLPQRDDVLYLQNRYNELYWQTYLEDSKTLYIQYNLVLGNSPDSGSISQFSKTLEEIITTQPVEKVILDMRHNPGGDNTTYRPLLELLTKSETINQSGKLFVIIGRKTFSAAVNFVTELERDSHAIFVGESTGGSPNLYGDARTIQLPNSKLSVNISTKYWEMSTADDTRLWIEPQHSVELSSAEYFNNQDPALEFILEYTEKLETE